MAEAAWMAGFLGGYEIWVVVIVVVLLFGHRIPKVARSLGQGIVEFRKGLKGEGGTGGPDGKKLPDETPPPSNEGGSDGGGS